MKTLFKNFVKHDYRFKYKINDFEKIIVRINNLNIELIIYLIILNEISKNFFYDMF